MSRARTLRAWRRLKGETQRQAAAAVGIHYVTWSTYECGHVNPSALTLRRIARHFGIASDDILLFERPMRHAREPGTRPYRYMGRDERDAAIQARLRGSSTLMDEHSENM